MLGGVGIAAVGLQQQARQGSYGDKPPAPRDHCLALCKKYRPLQLPSFFGTRALVSTEVVNEKKSEKKSSVPARCLQTPLCQ